MGLKGYAVKRAKNVADEAAEVDLSLSLDALLKEGARRMLMTALQAEVDAYLEAHADERDEAGRRFVVRNGTLPKREILTGAGPLEIEQPRVRDRRGVDHPEATKFTSAVLPRYLRKSRSIAELLPWLYLKGISTGGFQEALQALLGEDVKGLSPSTISRLTASWADDHEAWSQSDLSGKRYVYLWADGIHFNIRVEGGHQCILVVMGATDDGKKELVGILDGERESEQSWRELLLDLKQRGLERAPKVAVGDGALGFWTALSKVFPDTRHQRCWVHKTANILNKLPKKAQPAAKDAIHQIWMASTRKEALEAWDLFVAKYEAKYPKAVACLVKDQDELLAFYDFPCEHWGHLRTTNPIESTFATVRLRHRRTKGSATRRACLGMVFKLVQSAEKSWRRLNSRELLLRLVAGDSFEDGILVEKNAA